MNRFTPSKIVGPYLKRTYLFHFPMICRQQSQLPVADLPFTFPENFFVHGFLFIAEVALRILKDTLSYLSRPSFSTSLVLSDLIMIPAGCFLLGPQSLFCLTWWRVLPHHSSPEHLVFFFVFHAAVYNLHMPPPPRVLFSESFFLSLPQMPACFWIQDNLVAPRTSSPPPGIAGPCLSCDL